MSVPCNIKTINEAWNHAVKSFSNAFRLTGDATKSIKYTLNELKEKYPDINFREDSVTEPLIEKLKEKGLVDKNYQYRKQKLTSIEKAFNNFKDLSDPDKKKLIEALSKKDEITPQNIKNEYAALKGYPHLTPEFNKLIDQTATDRQAYEAIDRRMKTIFGRIQELKKDGKYTSELEKEFGGQLKALRKERNKALGTYMASDLAFGEYLSKTRHLVYQFGDMGKMNLMSIPTLLKNNTGMAADWIFRSISKLVAAPIELAVLGARRAMGKTNATYGSITLLAHTEGAFKSSAGNRLKLYGRYGSDAVYSDKVRTPNYIDGVRNIRNIMNGESKFKNILAFALKLSPTVITRGLGAPDAFVTEMATTAELNRIGKEKGYTGAELQAFILSPDEASMEKAKDYGKLVTYKKDMPLSDYIKLNMDFAKIGDDMIAKGGNPFMIRLGTGIAHLLKNRVAPFVTTPINLLRTANRIVLPEYTLAKGLYQASKLKGDEQTHKIISTVAEAGTGLLFRMVAIQLVSQALISAGHDDEEDKVGETIEKKTGGFNRINMTAAMRGLLSGEVKEEKGDVYGDINALGGLGIAFGAYAHAYKKYGKEDVKKQLDYLKNGNYFSIPVNSAMSQLSSSLDFTFMTGWNDGYKAVKGEGTDREKWGQESFMFMLGAILPAQHQQFSKASTESRPRMYDKNLNFSQNVYNTMGYRFFFKVPDKTFKVLTEHGEKTERVKEHLMFDNYWGRVLAATDPFKTEKAHTDVTPTTKLYDAMQTVDKKERDNIVPTYVSDKVTIKGNKDIVLNKEQYYYFQQQTSLYRMVQAAPYIMSKEFDKASYKDKCTVLQAIYEKQRSHALEDVRKKYFPTLKKKINKDDANLEKVKRKYVGAPTTFS